MRTDIILDDNLDLPVGDAIDAVGQSDAQNVELLLMCTAGSIRQYPGLGVGVANFIKKQSNTLTAFKRAISVNLKADNYLVTRLDIGASGEFTLEYEPNY